MSLPNLSALCIAPSTCRPCEPAASVGQTFEEFADAQRAVGPVSEQRDDWSPAAWGGEDSPPCPICLEPLHRRSRGDFFGRKVVEALFEVPACSHCFHRDCFEDWVTSDLRSGAAAPSKRALLCPVCSRPIHPNVINDVLDAAGGSALQVKSPTDYDFSDGASEDGASEGGASEDGASEGGASEGGASEGSASEGSASEGSETEEEFRGIDIPFEEYPDAIRVYFLAYPSFSWDQHAFDAYYTLKRMLDTRYVEAGQASVDDLDEFVKTFAAHYDQIARDAEHREWRPWLRAAVVLMEEQEPEWAEAFRAWPVVRGPNGGATPA